jgi:hypothetical protein
LADLEKFVESVVVPDITCILCTIVLELLGIKVMKVDAKLHRALMYACERRHLYPSLSAAIDLFGKDLRVLFEDGGISLNAENGTTPAAITPTSPPPPTPPAPGAVLPPNFHTMYNK